MFRSLLTMFLFSASVLFSQGPEAVIRVDVDLRQVDLVVTDAKGQHVNDLGPEDFLVLEDGKPQKLSNFSWIEVTPPPTGARLKALQEKPSFLEKFSGVARHTKTPGNDILAAPVANLRQGEIRRVIAFVFHDTWPTAVDRVRKFIDEQMAPGDMISVRSTKRSIVPHGATATIRDSMGIFQQFTNDKRQLDAATDRVVRTCDFLNRCVPDVQGTLLAAIHSLESVPGRKSIVFIGGYKGPVEPIIDMANRAGVVINVLNPAGTPLNAMVEGFPGSESAVNLAKQTGGRWLISTPGFELTHDLNEVAEDLSGYYLLGYHSQLDKDSGARPPARPKIEVRVLRPGLLVHARNGFVGDPRAVANPVPPDLGRDAALTNAMFSPFTSDGIRVHLDPLFFASPPDPKKGKRTPIVRAVLDVDGHDMTHTEAENGARRMVLDVALAVFNADGTQAGARNQTFTIVVPREKLASRTISPQYKVDIPVAKPGAYQVRTAVRDAASREIGSAYAFLNIPDFNEKKLSLSSLLLSMPAGAPAAPGLRPEWNEFAPGTRVQFTCEIFGFKTSVPPGVEVAVKLYRGGGPVVDIPPVPATIENKTGETLLTGSLQIPDDLAAGNYAMEIIVYNRLAGEKKQSAVQWSDLTVARPEAAR